MKILLNNIENHKKVNIINNYLIISPLIMNNLKIIAIICKSYQRKIKNILKIRKFTTYHSLLDHFILWWNSLCIIIVNDKKSREEIVIYKECDL